MHLPIDPGFVVGTPGDVLEGTSRHRSQITGDFSCIKAHCAKGVRCKNYPLI
jgi:hypothetical protein